MSIFPKIQSPCPYKGTLADIMDGSTCRLCKREVHDLTDMSDGERMALLAGCKSEICVSYRVGARSVLAAITMGAAVTAVPAAACSDCGGKTSAQSAQSNETFEEDYIIVGGMKKPHQAKWVKDEQRSNLPQLPVVYEDEKPAGKEAPKSPPAQKAG